MVRLGYPESSIEKPLGISGAIFLQDSRLPFLLSNQQCQSTSSLFFHGKLVLSVAVSTTDRKASQLVAFLLAEDRPMFKGLKSDSTACSHVCLGCPTGCLQPDDDFRIATEGKLNGSVKEPNIFHNYETEKITRKASDVAENLQLYRVVRFFRPRSSCRTHLMLFSERPPIYASCMTISGG